MAQLNIVKPIRNLGKSQVYLTAPMVTPAILRTYSGVI